MPVIKPNKFARETVQAIGQLAARRSQDALKVWAQLQKLAGKENAANYLSRIIVESITNTAEEIEYTSKDSQNLASAIIAQIKDVTDSLTEPELKKALSNALVSLRTNVQLSAPIEFTAEDEKHYDLQPIDVAKNEIKNYFDLNERAKNLAAPRAHHSASAVARGLTGSTVPATSEDLKKAAEAKKHAIAALGRAVDAVNKLDFANNSVATINAINSSFKTADLQLLFNKQDEPKFNDRAKNCVNLLLILREQAQAAQKLERLQEINWEYLSDLPADMTATVQQLVFQLTENTVGQSQKWQAFLRSKNVMEIIYPKQASFTEQSPPPVGVDNFYRLMTIYGSGEAQKSAVNRSARLAQYFLKQASEAKDDQVKLSLIKQAQACFDCLGYQPASEREPSFSVAELRQLVNVNNIEGLLVRLANLAQDTHNISSINQLLNDTNFITKVMQSYSARDTASLLRRYNDLQVLPHQQVAGLRRRAIIFGLLLKPDVDAAVLKQIIIDNLEMITDGLARVSAQYIERLSSLLLEIATSIQSDGRSLETVLNNVLSSSELLQEFTDKNYLLRLGQGCSVDQLSTIFAQIKSNINGQNKLATVVAKIIRELPSAVRATYIRGLSRDLRDAVVGVEQNLSSWLAKSNASEAYDILACADDNTSLQKELAIAFAKAGHYQKLQDEQQKNRVANILRANGQDILLLNAKENFADFRKLKQNEQAAKTKASKILSHGKFVEDTQLTDPEIGELVAYIGEREAFTAWKQLENSSNAQHRLAAQILNYLQVKGELLGALSVDEIAALAVASGVAYNVFKRFSGKTDEVNAAQAKLDEGIKEAVLQKQQEEAKLKTSVVDAGAQIMSPIQQSRAALEKAFAGYNPGAGEEKVHDVDTLRNACTTAAATATKAHDELTKKIIHAKEKATSEDGNFNRAFVEFKMSADEVKQATDFYQTIDNAQNLDTTVITALGELEKLASTNLNAEIKEQVEQQSQPRLERNNQGERIIVGIPAPQLRQVTDDEDDEEEQEWVAVPQSPQTVTTLKQAQDRAAILLEKVLNKSKLVKRLRLLETVGNRAVAAVLVDVLRPFEQEIAELRQQLAVVNSEYSLIIQQTQDIAAFLLRNASVITATKEDELGNLIGIVGKDAACQICLAPENHPAVQRKLAVGILLQADANKLTGDEVVSLVSTLNPNNLISDSDKNNAHLLSVAKWQSLLTVSLSSLQIQNVIAVLDGLSAADRFNIFQSTSVLPAVKSALALNLRDNGVDKLTLNEQYAVFQALPKEARPPLAKGIFDAALDREVRVEQIRVSADQLDDEKLGVVVAALDNQFVTANRLASLPGNVFLQIYNNFNNDKVLDPSKRAVFATAFANIAANNVNALPAAERAVSEQKDRVSTLEKTVADNQKALEDAKEVRNKAKDDNELARRSPIAKDYQAALQEQSRLQLKIDQLQKQKESKEAALEQQRQQAGLSELEDNITQLKESAKIIEERFNHCNGQGLWEWKDTKDKDAEIARKKDFDSVSTSFVRGVKAVVSGEQKEYKRFEGHMDMPKIQPATLKNRSAVIPEEKQESSQFTPEEEELALQNPRKKRIEEQKIGTRLTPEEKEKLLKLTPEEEGLLLQDLRNRCVEQINILKQYQHLDKYPASVKTDIQTFDLGEQQSSRASDEAQIERALRIIEKTHSLLQSHLDDLDNAFDAKQRRMQSDIDSIDVEIDKVNRELKDSVEDAAENKQELEAVANTLARAVASVQVATSTLESNAAALQTAEKQLVVEQTAFEKAKEIEKSINIVKTGALCQMFNAAKVDSKERTELGELLIARNVWIPGMDESGLRHVIVAQQNEIERLILQMDALLNEDDRLRKIKPRNTSLQQRNAVEIEKCDSALQKAVEHRNVLLVQGILAAKATDQQAINNLVNQYFQRNAVSAEVLLGVVQSLTAATEQPKRQVILQAIYGSDQNLSNLCRLAASTREGSLAARELVQEIVATPTIWTQDLTATAGHPLKPFAEQRPGVQAFVNTALSQPSLNKETRRIFAAAQKAEPGLLARFAKWIDSLSPDKKSTSAAQMPASVKATEGTLALRGMSKSQSSVDMGYGGGVSSTSPRPAPITKPVKEKDKAAVDISSILTDKELAEVHAAKNSPKAVAKGQSAAPQAAAVGVPSPINFDEIKNLIERNLKMKGPQITQETWETLRAEASRLSLLSVAVETIQANMSQLVDTLRLDSHYKPRVVYAMLIYTGATSTEPQRTFEPCYNEAKDHYQTNKKLYGGALGRSPSYAALLEDIESIKKGEEPKHDKDARVENNREASPRLQ